MYKIIPTEEEECTLFWDYCQIKLKLGKALIHFANEGKRSFSYARRLKRIGLTRGVCDYAYLVPNGTYHSLWIEMKRKNGRNKKKDPDQEAFLAMLKENGHYSTYAYGADDAIAILTAYQHDAIHEPTPHS